MTDAVSVHLDRIWKTYPKGDATRFVALKDATLEVPAGKVVSIVGPSGCGKSTLLKIVAGLIPRDRGQIRFGTGHGGRETNSVAGKIGMVFQDPELLPWKTTLQNTLFGAEVRSRKLAREMRPRADELLELVGLGRFKDSYPSQLSGGMRQRNAVARALLLGPAVLLMDEPFGALDALTRERITFDLQDIVARSGSTVLFVTHSITESAIVGDRVVVMGANPGRILDVVDVDLPRPRPRDIETDPAFGEVVRHIRALLDSAEEESTKERAAPLGEGGATPTTVASPLGAEPTTTGGSDR